MHGVVEIEVVGSFGGVKDSLKVDFLMCFFPKVLICKYRLISVGPPTPLGRTLRYYAVLCSLGCMVVD
jgi:hypothetical protein